MFGVIVCPRCGRANGIELPKRTTTCGCGFEFRVFPAMVRFEASSPRDIAAAVGRINAELRGGTHAVAEAAAKPRRPSRDAFARIAATANRAGDRRRRIRAAAEGLTRELVLFTADDWRRILALLGIPGADDALEELARGNVVYEPKPGLFRTV